MTSCVAACLRLILHKKIDARVREIKASRMAANHFDAAVRKVREDDLGDSLDHRMLHLAHFIAHLLHASPEPLEFIMQLAENQCF